MIKLPFTSRPKVADQEILRRRDMRDALTFTIDPTEARDFDDALSFVDLGQGLYQVGVHIADVSHFVQTGSDLDRRAYDLGTSTYLVDRVLPMLPEELCNDICSLCPNEDRLCMSVVFDINSDAQVQRYKVCRTVIRSDYRLTYDQAQAIITTPHPDEALSVAITTLNAMALIMRQQRIANGALELEQDEVHFRLDEQGMPIEIGFHTLGEANHLIEEFMLLANRTIATHLGKIGKDMVYRVHDRPDEDKLEDITRYRSRMGDQVNTSAIDMLTIRAMAKAIYSTHNIGHYGLAFDYYTHFTSPIRRYPDLMVHRIVAKYILGERVKGLPFCPLAADLQEACHHCSEREQQATQEERDSIKLFQTLWVQNHIGEQGDAIITNVTEYGLFVKMLDNSCEGLIPIRTICPGHYLKLDEHNFCLRTQPIRRYRRGHLISEIPLAPEDERFYTIGQTVRVRITHADVELRQINFELTQ